MSGAPLRRPKRRRLASQDADAEGVRAQAEAAGAELPADLAKASGDARRPRKKRKVAGAKAGAADVSAEADDAAADIAVDEETSKKGREGIVHFASLPTAMKPEKLRHEMEQFGEIGRVYLAPEDKTDRNRRKKTGGNRKLRYTEGWVEFLERKIAKRVAWTLNGTPVGGKKRHNFYRDDLWNVRYLPKFKWHQLKEGAIYNQQVRKAKLEQKVSQRVCTRYRFDASPHRYR
eukprot:TRINITY_DN1552_c1_g2_i1.p1 TRINITY_DN1552_c1_g2~~TRINITY_DN1552_c1_g2_i1.p1  ORF type:complete len:250 (+),score=50.72 TRINITY_DN1552_c1_g2_i1:57-752(+)